MKIWCLLQISGPTIRWWRSNGSWRDILYGSRVRIASNWWMGFGNWSADHVVYWLTKHQGLWSLSHAFLPCHWFALLAVTHHLLYVICHRRFFSSQPWNLRMNHLLKVLYLYIPFENFILAPWYMFIPVAISVQFVTYHGDYHSLTLVNFFSCLLAAAAN